MQSPINIKTVSSFTRAIDILNIAVLDWQVGKPSSLAAAGPNGAPGEGTGTQALSAAQPPKLFLDLPVNSRFEDVAGAGAGAAASSGSQSTQRRRTARARPAQVVPDGQEIVASPRSTGAGAGRRLLNYGTGPFESFEDHAFTVTSLGDARLFVDGAAYSPTELLVHTPSEHAIDGVHADLELQLIHSLTGAAAGDAARHVVVSVLLNTGGGGAEPSFLTELAATIGMEHFGNGRRWLARDFTFKEVAGTLRGGARMTSYYKYPGSLTRPPCTEDVTWFVLKHPLAVAPATLARFTRLQGSNNRPLQPANDRIVQFTP